MTSRRPKVSVLQVAPRAHVAVARIDDVIADLPVPRHTDDAARGLPSWRAREYRAVRALLAFTLPITCPDARRPPALFKEVRGRPALDDQPEVGVSLSHSEDTVAVAVAVGQAVGVDVQPAWLPGPGMLRRCCLPDDVRGLALMSPGPRSRRFARIWAAQEACVKATGDGLSGRPWDIPVGADRDTGSWGTVRWQHLSDVQDPMAVCCALVDPSPSPT